MGAVDSAAASGAAQAGSTVLGDSAASAPASLGATSLPVLLDASLVQDEASQIDWVVQTAEDGTVRTVVLDVPSRADILALWGLSDNVSSPDAQEAGTDADADSLDAADKAQTDRLVAALIALVSPSRAGEPPAPTRTPGTETTAKQVVTQWADNNIGSRPSTEAVSPTLAFTLYDAEGDVMHVDGDGLIVPAVARRQRIFRRRPRT